jgi:PAS domain S-box-containing protein
MTRRAPSSQPTASPRRSFQKEDAKRRAALALNASLNPDEVLTAVARQACALIGGQRSAVYLFDAKVSLLQLVTGHRLPDGLIGTTTMPGQGVVGQAFRRRHAVVVDDSTTEPGRKIAAVSLVAGSDRWGVLEVARGRRGRRFNTREIATLEWFAPLAAEAIANTVAFDHSLQTISQLQISNELLRAVGNIARAVIDLGYDLDQMLTEVLERMLVSLDLRGGAVLLVDEHTRQLEIVVERDMPDTPRLHRTPHRKVLVEPLNGQDGGILASVPLVARERIVGAMQVVTVPGQTLSASDQDALAIVANQLALGIENARFFQQVRTEEQRLRAVLSSTDNAVLGVDAGGRLLIANTAAERAFDFQTEACIGQILSKVTSNAGLHLALDQVHHPQDPSTRRFQISLPDGRVLSTSKSPILSPGGAVQGWVFVMQDITQFKEAEALQADMLLTAAHELRNPINLAMGALELLEQQINTQDESWHESMSLANLGITRAEALIKDLLDLERIARRIGLKMGRCDCTQLVRIAVAGSRLQAQSNQVSLEAHIPDDPLLVWGDERLLTRVINNLVDNAFKYTEQGGRVSIAARAEAGQVILEISDTGQGIPREAQTHIFERFYRLPNQPDRIKGTGLGLTIVKSIVEQHGGRVWVTSQPGHGSTFTVSLSALETNSA